MTFLHTEYLCAKEPKCIIKYFNNHVLDLLLWHFFKHVLIYLFLICLCENWPNMLENHCTQFHINTYYHVL